MSTLTSTQLQQQYIAYFGRPGDPSGIKYWLSSSSGISSAREFADKIYAQDEYKTSTVGGKSTEQQVNQLYQNLFGREADAAGLLYWTGEIEAERLVLSNVAYDLIWAASNPVTGNDAQATTDAAALANKVAAAEAFTTEVEASTTAILAYQPESTSPWKSGAAFNEAVSFIATATSTNAPTATDVTASVTTITTTSNATSGSSFTLTNTNNQTTGGADNFKGGTGDDTFLATSDGSYDNGDVIDGGAGTDTLEARYALSANKTVLGSIKNVEKIIVDIDDSDTAAAETLTLGVDGFTGLTQVVAKNADSDATNQDTILFNNIATGVELGVTNGDADSDVDFVFKTTTSTTDTATLNLNAAKADEITIAGIETITVDGESGKSTIDTMVTAAATKYVITGSGEVILTDIGDLVKTIDGSASTGGFTVGGHGTLDATITGGSGDDTVKIGTSLTVKDTIDLGAGTDRITVGGSETTALPLVSNVEEVELEAANQANNASLTISGKAIPSATKFVVDVTANADGDDVTATFSNLDDDDTISIVNASSDTTSAADGVGVTGTLTSDTSADDITLSLEGIGAVSATATDDTGVSVVTLDSHETINLVSNNNSTASTTANGVESLEVDSATSIIITGVADIDLDGVGNTTKLTLVDATAATGKVTIDGFDKSDLVFKAGANDTIISLASLDQNDQLIGGASAKDYVTATAVTGLTATTGKINIQDFETVEINATGANTFDLSLLSGVTTFAISGGTPGNQTLTGVGTDVSISVGEENAVFDAGNDVDITLADETGTADKATIVIDNRKDANTDVDILTDSTIEEVVLDLKDDDTIANNATVTMTDANAATITLKGGFAGQTLTLDTLSKTTTTVDASELDADLTFTAGAVDVGMTVTMKAAQEDDNVVLSSKDDTLTVGKTGAVSVDLDGSTGTDTMNITVAAGFADTDEIDGFEKLNFTVNSGDDISIGANGGDNGQANAIADATTVTITGGNELSTFEVGDANNTLSDNITAAVDIDASAFEGNVYLEWNTDIFTATTDVDAGALLTDTVMAVFDTTNTDIVLPLTGVETFIADIDSGNDATTEQYNFDVDTATGLKTIAIMTGTSGSLVDIDDYVSTVTVQLGTDGGQAGNADTQPMEESTGVDINLKSSAATDDVVNLSLFDTDDQAGTIDVDAAGVETLNVTVSDDDESHKIDLAGVTATSGSKLAINITGGVNTDGVQITNMSSTTNVLDASAYLGAITIDDRSANAMTITSGTDDDTLRMENTGDVIDAGSGTDTLVVSKELILGGLNVDLSTTGDQITTFNGSANAGIQKGFEHVNLAGVTGSFGAEITARTKGSTIRGTFNRDSITLGTDATMDDTIIVTGGLESAAGKNDASDIVTNFTVGANNDVIQLDVSDLETAGRAISGKTLNLIELNDGTDLTSSSTVALQTLTASAAAAANQTIFLHNVGTYADADAAVNSFEIAGSYDLTFAVNLDASDAFLFAYETSGGKVSLAAAMLIAADNNDSSAAGHANDNLDGIDLLLLDDVSEVSGLAATNFAFIA